MAYSPVGFPAAPSIGCRDLFPLECVIFDQSEDLLQKLAANKTRQIKVVPQLPNWSKILMNWFNIDGLLILIIVHGKHNIC